MKLSGLHFLLTYQCTFACDHCFVWGSPWQQGTMTLENIQNFLQQAKDTQSIKNIAFEGGEPFLYYGTLLQAVKMAAEMGFRVGIVSNAYWATSPQDALVWLTPFQGLIDGLTVSSDLYHYDEQLSRQAQSAQSAASELGISTIGLISVAQPEEINATRHVGQLPNGAGAVMYRGRAADKLAPRAEKMPWECFTACPHEDLSSPGRVHLDAFGNLHICQGISIGNLFRQSLNEICDRYDPLCHPIIAPLLAGGPAELTCRYQVPHVENYADACHLCFETRRALRHEFPDMLTPDAMYGGND